MFLHDYFNNCSAEVHPFVDWASYLGEWSARLDETRRALNGIPEPTGFGL